MDRHTVTVMRAHRDRQSEQRLSVGALWKDHDLVFAGDDGAPLLPRSVSAAFRKDVTRCEMPRITVHGMRHTQATMMMGLASPKVVQERLGHANVSITLGTYSHVQPGMQREAVDKLSELMGRADASAT
ncbi:MAG: putative prophage phiRv2 integrase [Thermoleophilia bacterium]|nr:putative prophage phiRv2 integrase [Thermoleophilia bacterium]